MSSPFGVDLEQLEHIVARLNGLADYVREHLDDLDRRVSAMHSGTWSGIAARAHAEAHSEWLAGAREFNTGIADMGRAAHLAHGHYTNASEANLRMLRGE